ncbi:helix-turn-helix domain-containing protein [Sneathiella glossodoripedis]|uniref:helix-turn-helix domain-containing protein n=1 Tax=Sneathiella glossodoripedis TaxID=418853 RepID=UPI0006846782
MSNLSEGEDVFGARLKAAREKRDLNQTELAKVSGLQPAAIGHFEAGRRKPSFANIRAWQKPLRYRRTTFSGAPIACKVLQPLFGTRKT